MTTARLAIISALMQLVDLTFCVLVACESGSFKSPSLEYLFDAETASYSLMSVTGRELYVVHRCCRLLLWQLGASSPIFILNA